MAANFPNSPSPNDTFTDNGLTFVWNGSAWKLNSSSGTKGEKGQKGEVGVTGTKGQKGEKGEVGAKGQKGEIGATGGTGGTGSKGQKGEVGATGSTGAAASKGQKGEAGDKGATGGTGDTGSTGDKGQKGEASTVKGDKGQKGELGTTGDKGATGAGDKGQKGEEGPQGGGAPVGQIVAWSGSASSLPTGYFLCDGSAISRTTYAALFTVVGTTHGAGNGSTTFNIPDLRDRFVVGASSSGGYSVGNTGGSKDAVLVSHTHNLQNHVHGINLTTNDPGNHSHGIPKGRGGSQASISHYVANTTVEQTQGTFSTTSGGSHSHTVSGNTGASVPNTTDTLGESATNKNLPPYYALAYIIQFSQGGETAKGQKGETGSTGSTGSTGDKGQKGEAGDKGAASSVQGPTGDKGQKGDKGQIGADGGSGADGSKGQKGEVGAGGSTGSDGSDGDKGQKGEVGNGAKGQKGDDNSTKGQKGEPAAGANGVIKQVKSTTTTSSQTISVGSGATVAIPNFSVSITPSSSSSKILVSFNITGAMSDSRLAALTLNRDGSAISGATGAFASAGSISMTGPQTISFQYVDSPSSTSSLTYSLTVKHEVFYTNTFSFNRDPGSGAEVFASTITAMEIG